MFFFGIFGIQQKERTIKEFDNIICPDCGRLTRAELMESYTYFHFLFIPLLKWNRQYYLRLRCCGSSYMGEADYVDELRHREDVDCDRPRKMQMPSNVCPNCGAYIHPNFAYCPYCGQKR